MCNALGSSGLKIPRNHDGSEGLSRVQARDSGFSFRKVQTQTGLV